IIDRTDFILESPRPPWGRKRPRRAIMSTTPQVWAADTTTARDRKRLLRCLIEDVQLRATAKSYQVRIVRKGGALTDRDVPRCPPGGRATATPLETIELVRTLAQEFDDAQIARILNRQGRRSGRGLAFTKEAVTSLRGEEPNPGGAEDAAARRTGGPLRARRYGGRTRCDVGDRSA